MVARPGSFVVVVPVKSPGAGKSRLSTYADADRARLAAGFAVDTVDAALRTAGVEAVVVVSDDADFASTLARRGAHVCADDGSGLNGALRLGASYARRRWPDLQPAALLADLPALQPDDLELALEDAAAARVPGFVEDADASGSTLYTASYDAFDPRFGARSSDAHRDAGVRPVPGILASLRRDVDDESSLTAALRLGVGEATAKAVGTAAPVGRSATGGPAELRVDLTVESAHN